VYDLLGTRTLLVGLQGLEIMDKVASSANVLYAKVAQMETTKKLEGLASAKYPIPASFPLMWGQR